MRSAKSAQVSQTATNVNDPTRMRFEEPSYHLKSHAEMSDLFPDVPEAILNTEMVAEICNLELDFGKQRLPEFPVPDGMDSNEYLSRICWEGYKSKLPGTGKLLLPSGSKTNGIFIYDTFSKPKAAA